MSGELRLRFEQLLKKCRNMAILGQSKRRNSCQDDLRQHFKTLASFHATCTERSCQNKKEGFFPILLENKTFVSQFSAML